MEVLLERAWQLLLGIISAPDISCPPQRVCFYQKQ
jgi:hypothetical protein